jgi:ribosome maturation factor RimP
MSEPLLTELGVLLYDLEIVPGARGARISITLDCEGSEQPGGGVSVGTLASFSRQLGYALDAEDVVPFDYHLEVSSPGIERTLRRDEHFARHVGSPVRVVTSGEWEGRTVHEGPLVAWGPDWIRVARDDGHEVELPRSSIRRARTVFDFSTYDAQPKPGKGRKSSAT